MRRVVCFILLFNISLIPLCQASTDLSKINISIIGDRNYAPYSYEEDNIAKGLYVKILTRAFDQLNDYQVTITMEPWKRGLSMIKKGANLAIFPPYYWPEKRAFISIYSEPIYKEQVVSICHKSRVTSNKMQWPNDYKGLKVGTNRGFLAPGVEFFELVKVGKIDLIETQNSERAIRLLSLKRIDCYVNSKLTINWTINNLIKSTAYKGLVDDLLYTSVISENNAYIGYSKRYLEQHPSQAGFIEDVNQVIRKMREEGVLANILKDFLAKP